MTAVNIHLVERDVDHLPLTALAIAKGECAPDGSAFAAVGQLGNADWAGQYERYSVLGQIGFRDRPFYAMPVGWLIIERLVFAYVLAPSEMLMRLAKYVGFYPREILEGARLTIISPDTPASLTDRFTEFSILQTMVPNQ